MSSRRQRPTRRPRTRARPPARSQALEDVLEATVTKVVSAIRRDAAGLAGIGDPLGAELLASALLSMWHAEAMEDPEPREILARAVMRRLASRPNPDALAVLLALEALGEPPLVEDARSAIAHMRAGGVPEPMCSRSIGRPTLVDAWISTDELEDQANVLAAFAYDHRPAHAINLIVDANFHGLIRDAFVADDPDKVRREWPAVSGLPIRALSEESIADVLGRGIEMFDVYLDPPVTDEVRRLMPLLRARLRLLPAPRSIEPRRVPDRERRRLVREFSASPEAGATGGSRSRASDPGGTTRRTATDLARLFVDFACDYGAGDPLRWSPIAVEILLADWLPRKAFLEADEIEALPEVLRRFVRFSAQRKGLSDEVIAETFEAIDRFAPDFSEGMADTERAGPAKQLVLEMHASGIDMTDEAAVGRWIDERNRALGGEPPRPH